MNREVPELDVDRNDDELVATACLYWKENLESGCACLDRDIGMAISATQCGLAYIMIPDAWLLPPEKDDKDRKIAELENKLRALPAVPMIEISEFSVSTQGPISMSELTGDMMDQLEDYEANPSSRDGISRSKVHEDSLSKLFVQGDSSYGRRDLGLRESYAKWLLRFREWVPQAFSALRNSKILCPIEFVLTNVGGVSCGTFGHRDNLRNLEMAPPSYSEKEHGFELPEIPASEAPPGEVVSRQIRICLDEPHGYGSFLFIEFARSCLCKVRGRKGKG